MTPELIKEIPIWQFLILIFSAGMIYRDILKNESMLSRIIDNQKEEVKLRDETNQQIAVIREKISYLSERIKKLEDL